MKTNQSNVSFQSIRVSCSKAKALLLSLAFLLCLSGAAWAQPLPFNLTMPDVQMLFKGSLVAVPDRQIPVPLPAPPIVLPVKQIPITPPPLAIRPR